VIGLAAKVKLIWSFGVSHSEFVVVLHALGEMQWVWHDKHSVCFWFRVQNYGVEK